MCLCFLSTTSSEFRSKIRGTNRRWEGQRGEKKSRGDSLDWRLKRARCTRARTISSAGMRALSAATEVVLTCWRRTGIKQACGAFLSMLTLRQYQKCMLSNTGLGSSVWSRRTHPENWYRAILHDGCIPLLQKKSKKCKNNVCTFARCCHHRS